LQGLAFVGIPGLSGLNLIGGSSFLATVGNAAIQASVTNLIMQGGNYVLYGVPFSLENYAISVGTVAVLSASVYGIGRGIEGVRKARLAFKANKALKDVGIDPKSKVDPQTINEFMDTNFKKRIASMEYKPSWKTSKSLVGPEGEWGQTIPTNWKTASTSEITFYEDAFKSAKRLYLVADHELEHVYHISSGKMAKWFANYGQGYAQEISERFAWESSIGTSKKLGLSELIDHSTNQFLKYYERTTYWLGY
jgi:hypothetical protein